jgi:hypothetical protein
MPVDHRIADQPTASSDRVGEAQSARALLRTKLRSTKQPITTHAPHRQILTGIYVRRSAPSPFRVVAIAIVRTVVFIPRQRQETAQ